jgi:hypothetical protein
VSGCSPLLRIPFHGDGGGWRSANRETRGPSQVKVTAPYIKSKIPQDEIQEK